MENEQVPSTAVTISRLGRQARMITLPDMEPRRTSSEALRLAGVSDGDSLTAAELSRLLDDVEPTAAMNRALRLLGHRERSRGELAARLHEDGFANGLVSQTLERLADLGYLDDARFTELFVRTKRSAGWSRMRIERGLREKRVDPELIVEMLDIQVPDDEEEDRAMDALGGMNLEDPAQASRALRRLLSRGFSHAVSYSAITRKRDAADD